ncbi:hypothetical protein ABZ917_37315 [Nonomuraea wenchangensis]
MPFPSRPARRAAWSITLALALPLMGGSALAAAPPAAAAAPAGHAETVLLRDAVAALPTGA